MHRVTASVARRCRYQVPSTRTGGTATAERRQIEYKLVRYEQGLLKRIAGDDFGNSFQQMLSEHGREGWDLKEIIRESGMEALLVFSREAA